MRDSPLNQGISDKEIERNQIKIINALRNPSNKQCSGRYKDKEKHCVTGLIHTIIVGELKSDFNFAPGADAKIIVALNLPYHYRSNLINLNDGGIVDSSIKNMKTFEELADILIDDYNFPNVPPQGSSNEVGL